MRTSPARRRAEVLAAAEVNLRRSGARRRLGRLRARLLDAAEHGAGAAELVTLATRELAALARRLPE